MSDILCVGLSIQQCLTGGNEGTESPIWSDLRISDESIVLPSRCRDICSLSKDEAGVGALFLESINEFGEWVHKVEEIGCSFQSEPATLSAEERAVLVKANLPSELGNDKNRTNRMIATNIQSVVGGEMNRKTFVDAFRIKLRTVI